MAAITKFTARTIAVLLAVSICASAQKDAGLVYSGRTKRAPAVYRVKLTSGVVDIPATVYLEPGQVTIRNQAGTDDIVIPDQQLLDATEVTQRRGMPFVKLSSAFQSCEDPREMLMVVPSAIAWDAVAGLASLFRHKRHLVTINYSRDGETRSETFQVSGKEASKLLKELQLRRGIAFVPGEE